MKKFIILIIVGILIFSIIFGTILYSEPKLRHYLGTSTGLKDTPRLADENFSIEKVIVGIQSSTALTIIDNDILFLEKETGKVRLFSDGILSPEPLWDFQVKMEGCECYTESGLLGITSFENQIYIYVTEESLDSKTHNNIYKFDWNNKQLKNQILLNKLPAVSLQHHGGAMVSDNDGNIFAVVGDLDFETALQNFDVNEVSDSGIILKVGIDQNVQSPSSTSNPDEHYYAVGIRNSFGLAIDPITNSLWMTENGTHEYDEINLTFPKFNSGWAKILGPATNDQLNNFHGYDDYVYSDPEFSWEDTIAPTGISFVNNKWIGHENSLFVGDCSGNLYRFILNENRDKLIFDNPSLQTDLVLNKSDSNNEIIFGENFGCITDVEYNPDDESLYIISYLNNGAIYKIKPKL